MGRIKYFKVKFCYVQLQIIEKTAFSEIKFLEQIETCYVGMVLMRNGRHLIVFRVKMIMFHVATSHFNSVLQITGSKDQIFGQ